MSVHINRSFIRRAVGLPFLSSLGKIQHLDDLALSNEIANIFQRAQDMTKDLYIIDADLHDQPHSSLRQRGMNGVILNHDITNSPARRVVMRRTSLDLSSEPINIP